MSTHPIIREANLSDALGIQECVGTAYKHYISRIGKPPEPMLNDYTDLIQYHKVFVAELNQIIGVLVLIQNSSNIILDNVAVIPDQQGKGIGKQLINLAESEAYRLGFRKLDTYTHQCMVENIEMYKTLGYTEIERKEEHGYNRVYMQKSLKNINLL